MKNRSSPSTQLYRLIKMKLEPLGLVGELPRGFRETLILVWALTEIPRSHVC